MKNTNSVWAWVGIIVLVAAVVLIVVNVRKNDKVDSTDTDTSLVPTEDVSAGSIDAPKTTGVAPVTMSYQNALETYATHRIQFDANCQATPHTSTYKNGTNVMLDNRAPDARMIHLGDLGTVSIKGYGFKIVNFSLAGLTKNDIAIDCDASQSVAIITVQK